MYFYFPFFVKSFHKQCLKGIKYGKNAFCSAWAYFWQLPFA